VLKSKFALLLRSRSRADGEARTRDLILTMDALYQLSYVGLTLES
jgi:hypothetical protein